MNCLLGCARFGVGAGVDFGLGVGVGFRFGVGVGVVLPSNITGGLVGDGVGKPRTGPIMGWVLIGFVPLGGTVAPGGGELIGPLIGGVVGPGGTVGPGGGVALGGGVCPGPPAPTLFGIAVTHATNLSSQSFKQGFSQSTKLPYLLMHPCAHPAFALIHCFIPGLSVPPLRLAQIEHRVPNEIRRTTTQTRATPLQVLKYAVFEVGCRGSKFCSFIFFCESGLTDRMLCGVIYWVGLLSPEVLQEFPPKVTRKVTEGCSVEARYVDDYRTAHGSRAKSE